MKFLAVLSIAIAAVPTAVSAAGGFYHKCSGINVREEGTTGPSGTSSSIGLYASCRNDRGVYATQRLELGGCVTNDNGRLLERLNGGFQGSTRSCKIEKSSAWLNCSARNKAGAWVNSRLDLNNFISNQNGFMACYNTISSTLREPATVVLPKGSKLRV